MTLHKIDREKLAEALHFQREFLERIRADGSKAIGTAEIITKAAENWLTITDPAYISLLKSICNVLDDTAKRFSGTPDDDDAELENDARNYSVALKAMIAKAGEP